MGWRYWLVSLLPTAMLPGTPKLYAVQMVPAAGLQGESAGVRSTNKANHP